MMYRQIVTAMQKMIFQLYQMLVCWLLLTLLHWIRHVLIYVIKCRLLVKSVLGEHMKDYTKSCEHHGDGEITIITMTIFSMTHPDTERESCIEHAVKIGLGTDQYELIQHINFCRKL